MDAGMNSRAKSIIWVPHPLWQLSYFRVHPHAHVCTHILVHTYSCTHVCTCMRVPILAHILCVHTCILTLIPHVLKPIHITQFSYRNNKTFVGSSAQDVARKSQEKSPCFLQPAHFTSTLAPQGLRPLCASLIFISDAWQVSRVRSETSHWLARALWLIFLQGVQLAKLLPWGFGLSCCSVHSFFWVAAV